MDRLLGDRLISALTFGLFAAAFAAGAQPVIDLSRGQVDFGRIPEHVASSVQPVFLSNTGNAPLTISSFTISGAYAAQFQAGGTCGPPSTLAPGERCRIDLVMTPKHGDFINETGLLAILSNAAPPESDISLTGFVDNANGPLGFVPNPQWIDFGNQPVGVPATSQLFSLSNPATAKLLFSVSPFQLIGDDSGDFSVASDCGDGINFPPGASCSGTIGFIPKANGPRAAQLLIRVTYAGIDGFFRYSVSGVGGAPPVRNYQGLWWNVPSGSESGWGINFAHQGDIVFASWFTYDLAGKALWLVATALKVGADQYSGKLYRTTGPPFSAIPFDSSLVHATEVGTATLNFSDSNNGSFAYTVNGIAQTKNITREIFGPVPTCEFGAYTNLALASNYQDLWWRSPAATESGWGINLTHQGDTIFATWFTYDTDGSPMWLVVTAQKSGPGVYAGVLYRTIGPAFNAVPFDPGKVMASPVGSATLTFEDGDTALFSYTVNGISQSKPITREIFASPGTGCK